MGKTLKSILAIVLLLILTAGVLFFLGKNLQKVSLEKFEIKGIEEITTDSFTIDGHLYLNNPSTLSVPIKTINYTILLKDSQQLLSSGSLPGFTLEANAVTPTVFYQKVQFLPSVALLLELLTKEKVFIVIKGTITVAVFGISSYEIPFETEVDIKEALVRQGKKKFDY